MKFTPEWVLKLTCTCVAVNFVMGQLPMRAYGNRYAKDLLLMYDDTTGDKIEQITQGMLHFLASFESDNHMEYVEAFMFNVINYEQDGRSRKLKSLFKSALDPANTGTSESDALMHFKNFVFSLRTDQTLAPPPDWTLAKSKGIDPLLKIYTHQVRVIDAF